jgi:hypothetical protein
MRESRTYGSVRAKPERLSYSTTLRRTTIEGQDWAVGVGRPVSVTTFSMRLSLNSYYLIENVVTEKKVPKIPELPALTLAIGLPDREVERQRAKPESVVKSPPGRNLFLSRFGGVRGGGAAAPPTSQR